MTSTRAGDGLLAIDADLVQQDGGNSAAAARRSWPWRLRTVAGVPGRHGRTSGNPFSFGSSLRSGERLADDDRLALGLFRAWISWKSLSDRTRHAPLGDRLAGLLLQALSGLLARLLARRPPSSVAGWPLVRCFSRSASRVPQRGEQAAFGGLVDHHVGHDALGLDRAAAGRVVARRGDLQAGVRAERRTVWMSPCRRSGCP